MMPILPTLTRWGLSFATMSPDAVRTRAVAVPVRQQRSSSPAGVARAALLCAAGLLLAGCAETQFAAQSAKSISGSANDWGKVGAYKVGNPYQVNGRWYYPKEDWEYQEEGMASWYGAEFHGKDTANGEQFDQNALTAAHKTLPMPSLVRVTNLQNGRALVLRVNDRGPFSNDRVIDVSRRASQLLGFADQGTARVRVEILAEESQALKQEALGVQTGTPVATSGAPSVVPAPRQKIASAESLDAPSGARSASSGPSASALPPPSAAVPQTRTPPAQPAASNKAASTAVAASPALAASVAAASGKGTYVQAGAFSNKASAEALRGKLSSLHKGAVSPVKVNGREMYRVRLGPMPTQAEADRLLAAVKAQGVKDARVVID